MASIPGWLSALFGPVRVKVAGVLLGFPIRSAVNFVNIAIDDDDDNDQTTLTAGGELASLRLTSTTSISTSGGTLSDYAIGTHRKLVFTNATPPTVTGFLATGISDGEVLVLENAGGSMTLKNNATSSTANRMLFGSGADVTFPSGCYLELRYSAAQSRWIGPKGV